VALIFPDNTPEGKLILNGGNMLEFMEANRVALNKVLPQYSQISAIELVEKEFEKTPKRSIKRFLYS
jgi:long-chain acyl-CoA synthetase